MTSVNVTIEDESPLGKGDGYIINTAVEISYRGVEVSFDWNKFFFFTESQLTSSQEMVAEAFKYINRIKREINDGNITFIKGNTFLPKNSNIRISVY